MTSSENDSRDKVRVYAEKAVNALTDEQREMLRTAMMSDKEFMAAVRRFEVFEEGEWES